MGGCLSSQDLLVGYGDDVSHLRPRAEPEAEAETTAAKAGKSFAISKRYENEVQEGGQRRTAAEAQEAFSRRSAAAQSKGSFVEAVLTTESSRESMEDQVAWRGAPVPPPAHAARGGGEAGPGVAAAAGAGEASGDGGGEDELAAVADVSSQDSFELARAATARELTALSRSFRQGNAPAWHNDDDGGASAGAGSGENDADMDGGADAADVRGRESRWRKDAGRGLQGGAAEGGGSSTPRRARGNDPQSWPRLQGQQTADALVVRDRNDDEPRSARLAGAVFGAAGSVGAHSATAADVHAALRHMSSSSELTDRPVSGAGVGSSTRHNSQQQQQQQQQHAVAASWQQGMPARLTSPQLAAKPVSSGSRQPSPGGSRLKLLASTTTGSAASNLPHSDSRGSLLLSHLQSRLDDQSRGTASEPGAAPAGGRSGGGGWDFTKKASHEQLPMSGVISGALPGSARGSADGGGSVHGGSGGGAGGGGGASRMTERASRLLASLHRLGAVAPVSGGQQQ